MPLTIGTAPASIHSLTSASESTAVAKNFLAISFSAAVALDEIE